MYLYFYIRNVVNHKFEHLQKTEIVNRKYTSAELNALAPAGDWYGVILLDELTPIINVFKSDYPRQIKNVLPV